MGAEIGNSTQKLHARGPIGMRELCTYKYVVEGDSQIRAVAPLARLGILGGTFNPPHVGASRVRPGGARPARARPRRCSCRWPRRRTSRCPTTRAPRSGWSCAGGPRPATSAWRCRDIEVRPGRAVVHRRYAGGDPCETTGARADLHRRRRHGGRLPEWREPERVLELARFAVAEREGAEREEIERRSAGLSGRERRRLLRHAAPRRVFLDGARPGGRRTRRSATWSRRRRGVHRRAAGSTGRR